MNLHVHIEVWNGAKFFATLEAAEFLLPVVVLGIRGMTGACLQVVGVCHHFATVVAEVRLLARVFPHVNSEV